NLTIKSTGRDALTELVRVPIDYRETALVNFAGPGGTVQTVPYYKVLNGEIKSEVVKDKAVFVGTTSEKLHDMYPTPFGVMPGVEMLANAFRTFEDQDFIQRVPSGVHYLVLLVIGVLTSFIMLRLKPLWGLLFTGHVAAVILAVGYLLLLHFNNWWPMA